VVTWVGVSILPIDGISTTVFGLSVNPAYDFKEAPSIRHNNMTHFVIGFLNSTSMEISF
jgi:hypothetical protein